MLIALLHAMLGGRLPWSTLARSALVGAFAMMVAIADATGPALASDEEALVAQKMRLVETLLGRVRGSTGLSGDSSSTLDIAETLLEVARQYTADGSARDAGDALDEALRLVAQVSRHHAGNASSQVSKRRHDDLLSTVVGMREALEKISGPPEREHAVLGASGPFAAALRTARTLAAAGDYDKASGYLKRAYDLVVDAVVRIRKNQTLEHRLEFGSVQEEFEYERERFRSTRMLLDLLLAERAPSDAVRNQMRSLIADAESLNGEAVQLASRQKYDAALQTEEAAVSELFKAMQRVGVFTLP